MKKKALILIDLQNDFCRGGSLEVPDADAIISIANDLQPQADLVIAAKDSHPPGHISFASAHAGYKAGDTVMVNNVAQELWPDHCIQGEYGAEFHPKLNAQYIQHLVPKGVNPLVDSYSIFFDNAHAHSTGLENYLRDADVQEIYIMGVATEYCVKYSCIDALRLGLTVYVIEDGCRGVNLKPGNVALALDEMRSHGANIIHSPTVIAKLRST